MEANPHAVNRAPSQPLELQGRMGGISLEQCKILIGESLDLRGYSL